MNDQRHFYGHDGVDYLQSVKSTKTLRDVSFGLHSNTLIFRGSRLDGAIESAQGQCCNCIVYSGGLFVDLLWRVAQDGT